MVPWEPSAPRQCGGWTLCDCCCWLLLPAALLLLARPDKLAAFPTSLSDCQTPTGWNCSGESAGEPAGPGARGRGVGQSCGLPESGGSSELRPTCPGRVRPLRGGRGAESRWAPPGNGAELRTAARSVAAAGIGTCVRGGARKGR